MASTLSSAKRIEDNRSAVDTVLSKLAEEYGIELGDVAKGPVFPEYTTDNRRMNVYIAISDREARLVRVLAKLAERIEELKAQIESEQLSASAAKKTSKGGGPK